MRFSASLVITLALSTLAGLSHAKVMYIEDNFMTPLRSGKTNEYRIVHKGLKSGSRVEIIEHDKESGYSLVRTEGGITGWLPTRFLTDQPDPKDLLIQTQAELEKSQNTLNDNRAALDKLQSEHSHLLAERDRLRRDLASVGAELERIKSVSTNALSLDARNQELQEINQQLKNEVELLTTDQQRLKDRQESDFMLLGAGLVVLGVLITLIVPLLKPATRRSDTWV